jgi:hypothetical protein
VLESRDSRKNRASNTYGKFAAGRGGGEEECRESDCCCVRQLRRIGGRLKERAGLTLLDIGDVKTPSSLRRSENACAEIKRITAFRHRSVCRDGSTSATFTFGCDIFDFVRHSTNSLFVFHA